MSAIATDTTVTLPHDCNQALGIGTFACDWCAGKLGTPHDSVKHRTVQFFVDSVLCGLSALALQTNAPTVLRDEAHEYPRDGGASCFGSTARVCPEKAIVANASAVREWDSNGTNFGYNPKLGNTAGEFGHNDFYAVPLAAAQVQGLDGAAALRGMMLLDEIRGRLAEVFSLKTYKIDHVVHGAIASAATWGAMLGATPEQIESAIGMVVAHYIPWRAIRAGKQLSDSKGASAAISTEVAVLSMQRSMRGFIGPKDIFRNPEAIWRQFEPTTGDASPFDLVLSHGGDDLRLWACTSNSGYMSTKALVLCKVWLTYSGTTPKYLRIHRPSRRSRSLRTSQHSESSATQQSVIQRPGKAQITQWCTSSRLCCVRLLSKRLKVTTMTGGNRSCSCQLTMAARLLSMVARVR